MTNKEDKREEKKARKDVTIKVPVAHIEIKAK